MRLNMGSSDRVFRFLVGVALVLVGVFFPAGGWSIAAFVAAGVLVLTSLVGWCPLYALFGTRTDRSGGPGWPSSR